MKCYRRLHLPMNTGTKNMFNWPSNVACLFVKFQSLKQHQVTFCTSDHESVEVINKFHSVATTFCSIFNWCISNPSAV